MVIDIAFFTAMTCLFSKRIDELEDWQDELEERLLDIEAEIDELEDNQDELEERLLDIEAEKGEAG